MHKPLLAIALVTALSALLSSAAPAQQGGPFAVEGGGRYATLADAVAAIGEGTGTIRIAPGTYRECAVQAGGDVTYQAEVPGSVIFAGRTCEEKAALVLHGRAAAVEGIVFERMAVADGNGAGIRLESGDLSVDNSVFRDSQQGILTASDAGHGIGITRSTFSRLGRCDNGQDCAHALYVGGYGRLEVSHCRFEAGTGGHYLKARARQVRIADNSFDDSEGRLTNYMIDLPSGAVGAITGNEMVQGRDKDNYSAFIAVGAEAADNPSDGLSISGNGARFVPGLQRRSTFVADWSGARLALGTNDLAPGIAPFEKR